MHSSIPCQSTTIAYYVPWQNKEITTVQGLREMPSKYSYISYVSTMNPIGFKGPLIMREY